MTPETEYIGRVRKDGGRSGDGQQLPSAVAERIDQLWNEIVTSKLGFKTLTEMRNAWRRKCCQDKCNV